MLRLQEEGGLTGLLVGGSIELDLVLGHDLPHDLTESRWLVVPAGSRKVDDGGRERVREQRMLRSGCLDARRSRSPSRRSCRFTCSRRKGRKSLRRVGVRMTVGS